MILKIYEKCEFVSAKTLSLEISIIDVMNRYTNIEALKHSFITKHIRVIYPSHFEYLSIGETVTWQIF